MDWELLEKWLVELLPSDGKHLIQALMECTKEQPGVQFIQGMLEIYPAIHDGEKSVQIAAINGLLTGICLGESWRRNQEGTRRHLEGYLEHQARKRGEHVVDFFVERAKKRD